MSADDYPTGCTFPVHPHPDHPCGRQVIEGVTTCPHCGSLDGSPLCACWEPMTVVDLLLENLATGDDTWTLSDG